jgi:hypothetical protein
MDDEHERLIRQLRDVHAWGEAAHQRFLAAQAQHNVDAMVLANEEHQALAAEARALVAQLRVVVDARFAPLAPRTTGDAGSDRDA